MITDCIEFSGKKRKLLLRGNCLDILSTCEAACCREWIVGLSHEEYETGLYEAEQLCIFTKKECDNKTIACNNRTYQLKKSADGACVHLNDSNKCSIYEKRPKVCSSFTCKGGWRLTTVFIEGAENKGSTPPEEKGAFVDRLTEDMVFVSHPLVKLRTVFYLKAKGEIIFIIETTGRCVTSKIQDAFHYPQLNDDLVMALIRLFDNKDSLKDIRRRFCDQHAVDLTKNEFYEIVWLLNKHNIVTDVRNFRGMLIYK
jgi:Fe-S-cluster containining protein